MRRTEEQKLPKGWTWAILQDITYVNPRAFDIEPQGNDLVSFIPMASVEAGTGRLDAAATQPWKTVKKGYTRFQEGDVLFAKITPCMENGKFAVAKGLVNSRGAGSTEFHVLRPTSGILPYYLLHYLLQNSLRQAAQGSMKGTAGQLRVPVDFLVTVEIPLPPLPEQHRIVAEIETQFARLDTVVTAFKRVQANLKRYRASVLQAACEGRLVPTEGGLARAEGRSYESADQLLQRILQERRAKWEYEQLANMKGGSKVPKDDRWKSKYREPAKPDTSELPELPEGWVWASPEQLASSGHYSLAIGPFGSNLKVSDYTAQGIPLVFVRNIRSQTFGGDSTNYISQEKAEALRAHWVSPGDILVTKMGDPPGDACLYPHGQPNAVITADCIKLRLHSILNWPMHFVYTINSQVVRQQILSITQGVAQLKISLARFRNLGFPLPPLSEQQRIVAEVERRLSVIDELESVIATNLKRADRLRQAILKHAFAGKLVPQDPTDEPASVLLERIRTERERPTEKPKVTPQQTNAPQPTGQPKVTAPVQGELALGLRE